MLISIAYRKKTNKTQIFTQIDPWTSQGLKAKSCQFKDDPVTYGTLAKQLPSIQS